MAQDPVSKMQVDPRQAAGQSAGGGWTYRSAAGCRGGFDANPGQRAKG